MSPKSFYDSIKFLLLFSALIINSFYLQGCGLIFGGEQRVDNKSHDYSVVRLDREKNNEWRFLAPEEDHELSKSEINAFNHTQPKKDEISDLAFEHVNTGTIISLNSVCKEARNATLQELSKYLLLGLNIKGEIQHQDVTIDGMPALESEVEALMSQRSPSGENSEYIVKIRTVVLRKNACTYDLMYIARPKHFENLESTFKRFVKGFHIE